MSAEKYPELTPHELELQLKIQKLPPHERAELMKSVMRPLHRAIEMLKAGELGEAELLCIAHAANRSMEIVEPGTRVGCTEFAKAIEEELQVLRLKTN